MKTGKVNLPEVPRPLLDAVLMRRHRVWARPDLSTRLDLPGSPTPQALALCVLPGHSDPREVSHYPRGYKGPAASSTTAHGAPTCGTK